MLGLIYPSYELIVHCASLAAALVPSPSRRGTAPLEASWLGGEMAARWHGVLGEICFS